VATLIGLLFAYVEVYVNLKSRFMSGLFKLVSMLPVVSPPFVLSLSVILLFGKAGLITRTRSESDKRQLDVTLTENGQAEAKVCAEKHAKFEAEALSVLTEDEKGQLLGMLDRLMEHWQDIEEKDRAVEK
jgi:hypothetical protein